MLCICFVLSCFLLKMEKGAHAQCRRRHEQLVQRCNSVVFSGVRRWLLAAAPQGCGSRILMYTGTGQGGFG